MTTTDINGLNKSRLVAVVYMVKVAETSQSLKKRGGKKVHHNKRKQYKAVILTNYMRM